MSGTGTGKTGAALLRKYSSVHDQVTPSKAARFEGVIGQRHGDDGIGGMPAPEQIVFPAVQVLGIERVDPRTDDLVPFDGPNVVPEQVDPGTTTQRDPLELVVGGERRLSSGTQFIGATA